MANYHMVPYKYCCIKGGCTGFANKTYDPVTFAEAKSGGEGRN